MLQKGILTNMAVTVTGLPINWPSHTLALHVAVKAASWLFLSLVSPSTVPSTICVILFVLRQDSCHLSPYAQMHLQPPHQLKQQSGHWHTHCSNYSAVHLQHGCSSDCPGSPFAWPSSASYNWPVKEILDVDEENIKVLKLTLGVVMFFYSLSEDSSRVPSSNCSL